MEAADLLRAEPEERPLPFEAASADHFRQVRRALELYREQIVKQNNTASLKLNNRDKATTYALAFIRKHVRPIMTDEDGKAMCDRIMDSLEIGRFSKKLPTEINKLAKIQKGRNPLTQDQLYDQIADLADTYCPESIARKSATTNVQPEIIVSETLI